MKKYLSVTDLIVIVITIILFITALFVKGLTHGLLLEAGVLLVSVKIIMMHFKHVKSDDTILKEIREIKKALNELTNS